MAQWSLTGIFAGTFSSKNSWRGVAHTTLALMLMLQSGASSAQDEQGSSSRVASASLRVTLTIPPRTQLVEAAESSNKLCISRIPASQLVVSWLPEGGMSAPAPPIATLTGDTAAAGCIDVGIPPQESESTATVLVAAQ